MNYGLSDSQLKEIKDILSSYTAVEEAVLFGSRAIDTYKEASDVDIAIKGKKADWSLAATLKDHFEEETYLPFFFDIVAYNSISSTELKEHINTKGIVIYSKQASEWKEYSLNELAQLEKNSWKVGDEELPYIALEHIVEGGLRLQGIGDSKTIASNKFRFNSDCFLFGKLRPYFRKLFRPDFDGICSTDIWVVKPKGKNDKDFLFYFFANQEFVDFTYSGSSGTRMPRADWNFVGESKWNFPEPTEQKAIAEVLSSLDDKIDLLHRQNRTLEQMAEAIFRQWFVEEADEGWEEVYLSDYIDFLEGPGIRNWQYTEVGVPFINIRLIQNGDIKTEGANCVSLEEGNGKYSHFHLEPDDMVMSTSGTLGRTAIVRKHHLPMILNTSVIRFRTHNRKTFSFMYQYLKSSEFYEHLISNASGSVQLNFGPTHLKRIKMFLPPTDVLNKFCAIADNYYAKIKSNQTQIQTLEKMRDTLLPKLMSGEVRISE